MSLRILVLFALIALIPVTAHAEILIMKDGRSINAKILNRDSKKIKIEENGRTVTYFLDQVQSINGKPMADWEEESAEEDATPADSGTTPAPAGVCTLKTGSIDKIYLCPLIDVLLICSWIGTYT